MDYKKQGKRNKAAGAMFEKRTREDLESKGWIVSKWQNNVEFHTSLQEGATSPLSTNRKKSEAETDSKLGKCVPSKPGRFRMMQTGFPDFIAYQLVKDYEVFEDGYNVIFVECKTNGYLKPEEKEKARWYLENNYCSKFLIAKRKKVGRKVEVEYVDFEEKYG